MEFLKFHGSQESVRLGVAVPASSNPPPTNPTPAPPASPLHVFTGRANTAAITGESAAGGTGVAGVGVGAGSIGVFGRAERGGLAGLFEGELKVGAGASPVGVIRVAGKGAVIELGAGETKDVNNGKIGYQAFGNRDSLDIVGAGTAGSDRRITFHAQGGSLFHGSVGIGGTEHLEFGAGVAKGPAAGMIAYQKWSNGLDIVGASTGNTITNRRITFHAQGGSQFVGSVGIEGKEHLEFGAGVAKGPAAGMIAYQKWSNGLDIVGASTGNNLNTRRITFHAQGGSLFGGSVEIDGGLTVKGRISPRGGIDGAGKFFKIDHPLAPSAKYLFHASVESPEMMNVYNGNVVTDVNGEAIVALPDYFETLNMDFRYQLTVIGDLAQAVVAREIEGNRFTVKTDRPGVKVSWQVTGIRQDAWAKANPMVVELAKPDSAKGRYLHPEAFGLPPEAGEGWHGPVLNGHEASESLPPHNGNHPPEATP